MKYSKKHVKNSKFSKKREIDAIWQKKYLNVISYHKKITGTRGSNFTS